MLPITPFISIYRTEHSLRPRLGIDPVMRLGLFFGEFA
jgi:hypothetical protein